MVTVTLIQGKNWFEIGVNTSMGETQETARRVWHVYDFDIRI
jgi:hypothetical protein